MVGLIGHVVDVSDQLRRATARDVDAAMVALVESRPLIERAKGALMMRHSVGPDEAFVLLQRRSQRSNVKVRDVALQVVDSLAATGTLGNLETAWDAPVDGAGDEPGPTGG